MKTSIIPVSVPAWHLIDAEGMSLGAIAAGVAHVLRGKHKTSFSPHQLCGDQVVIVNIEKLALSQAKGLRKMYYKHTGYPGHISKQTLGKKFENTPIALMKDAVKGMLPKNRLRPLMLKRLHVFVGPEHTYAAQKPVPMTLS